MKNLSLRRRLLYLVVFILCASANGYSQINGPTSTCVGVSVDYVFNNGSVHIGFSWLITNGSIITTWSSGTNYYATVQWAAGAGSLSFKKKLVLATINVSSASPATPTGGFTYSGKCLSHLSTEVTTITRTGTPPPGVTWYWQSSPTGTSTSIGDGSSLDAVAGSTYYLRAFESNCWSTGSLAASTIPNTPSTANHGLGCVNTAITISANYPSQLQLKWYDACWGGNYLATGPYYTTPPLSVTTAFYASVYDPSTTAESPRRKVFANVSAPYEPPSVLAPTNHTSTAFTANWSNSGGGIWYKLDVCTNQAMTSYVSGYNDLHVSGTSQAVSGLLPGGSYYYRVKAVKVSTITCESDESSTMETVTVPNPPTNFSTKLKSTSFIASWDPAIGATSYAIDVADSYDFVQGGGAYFQTFSTQTTSLEVTGLQTMAYYYRVRSLNFSGVSGNSIPVFAGNLDRNFVRTTSPLVEFAEASEGALTSSTDPSQKAVTTTFFDGLGRSLQQVLWKASPGQQDLVKPQSYDQFGRTRIEYLPYVEGQDGWYKADFVAKEQGAYNSITSPQYQFYHSTSATDIARSEKPYAETILESSPLSRVLKKGAPGDIYQPDAANWDMSTDHTIKMDYQFNLVSDNVLKWTYVSPPLPEPFGLVDAGTSGSPIYYEANQLLKTQIKDENQNLAIEFKDKEGRIVLKQVQVTEAEFAKTYYIYDQKGLLVCVIPPEATTRLSSEYLSQGDGAKRAFLAKWAFQYRYDKFRRQVVKRVPGADSVRMVYDDRDRLALTQDGVQRTQNQWSFTKYDALNRPVLTGVYSFGSLTRVQMQNAINTYYAQLSGQQAWNETFGPAELIHGYTNNSFPQVSDASAYLTATYYDGYGFVVPLINNGNASITTYNYTLEGISGQYNYGTSNDPKAFPRVVGQVTGAKVNILGSSSYLYSVGYFDKKGQSVQSIVQNHKGGHDRFTALYDFAGRTTQSIMTHNNGTAEYVVKRRLDYDHGSRLKKLFHTFQSEPEVLLTENVYNEIGQLVVKKSHSRSSGPFAQQTDYRFNIRGWMEKVNDPDAPAPNDLFSMKLYYDSPASNEDPQFNGNISEMRWASAGSDKQSYRYRYDKMSRLSEARFFNLTRPTQNGRYNEQVLGPGGSPGYDLNGNIKFLKRYGLKSPADYGLMDDLTYTYLDGNRLSKVDDAIATGSSEEGFIEQIENTTDYLYNENGSMSKDENKGITNITYNLLNLPFQVNKGATDYIVYTYDALGIKLKQQVFGSTPKTTEYIGEFVYENDVLQYVLHEEGRIVADNSQGAPRPWEYQYFLKDHLGNVRVTFSEKTTTTDYKATLEDDSQSAEQNMFRNYGNRSSFTLFNHTTAGTYSQLLNGSSSHQVGLAKSFAVNPGDVVDMEVYVKYEEPTSTGNNLTGFFSTLASAFSLNPAGGAGLEGQQAYNAFNGIFANGPYIASGSWDSGTAPRAYLNYILFDQNFALVDMGWQQVSTAAKQVGATPLVPHEYLSLHVKVQQAGYLYVYLSNETPQMTNVYFDDFQIRYTTAVEQVNCYYPFGLSQRSNGFERTSAIRNPLLFSGKEVQDELDFGWLDFGARMFDPFIAKWQTIDPLAEKYLPWSPYNFAFDNPVRNVDIGGLGPEDVITSSSITSQDKSLDETIVTQKDVTRKVSIDSETGVRTVTTTTAVTQNTITTNVDEGTFNVEYGKTTTTTAAETFDSDGNLISKSDPISSVSDKTSQGKSEFGTLNGWTKHIGNYNASHSNTFNADASLWGNMAVSLAVTVNTGLAFGLGAALSGAVGFGPVHYASFGVGVGVIAKGTAEAHGYFLYRPIIHSASWKNNGILQRPHKEADGRAAIEQRR